MKLFTIAGVAAAALAAKFAFFPCDCGKDEGTPVFSVVHTAPSEPAGEYLEARNVTLWGGYCHLNGEYDTYGDGALVAWSIERGQHDGVDLAGTRVVAALAAVENLAEGGARGSEVWIDAPNEDVRRACAGWLEAEHADGLGRVLDVHFAPIEFERSGDTFRVEVDGVCAVEGVAMADGTCCSMPEQRGYEPLMADAGAVIGAAQLCRFDGTAHLRGWEFADANNVFVEGFGPKAQGEGAEGVCGESKGCCPTSREIAP